LFCDENIGQILLFEIRPGAVAPDPKPITWLVRERKELLSPEEKEK